MPTHPRVTIYTNATCHWCRRAKAYLAEQGIQFREKDIQRDRSAFRDMVLMTGQRGVPVIEVGGRAMVGWNPEEFERLRSGQPHRR